MDTKGEFTIGRRLTVKEKFYRQFEPERSRELRQKKMNAKSRSPAKNREASNSKLADSASRSFSLNNPPKRPKSKDLGNFQQKNLNIKTGMDVNLNEQIEVAELSNIFAPTERLDKTEEDSATKRQLLKNLTSREVYNWQEGQ